MRGCSTFVVTEGTEVDSEWAECTYYKNCGKSDTVDEGELFTTTRYGEDPTCGGQAERHKRSLATVEPAATMDMDMVDLSPTMSMSSMSVSLVKIGLLVATALPPPPLPPPHVGRARSSAGRLHALEKRARAAQTFMRGWGATC